MSTISTQKLTYTIKVSTKVPVTLWYDGRHCPPIRQIVYRVPRVKLCTRLRQLAMITFDKRAIPVLRYRKTTADRWGEWSAIYPLNPVL